MKRYHFILAEPLLDLVCKGLYGRSQLPLELHRIPEPMVSELGAWDTEGLSKIWRQALGDVAVGHLLGAQQKALVNGNI